ncbi:MAG: isopenicillin N-epimerase [Myxococcaceae bacterium]|nr:isopenicillin N-epimerase [Myxococcaceae bacterium]
MWTLDPAITFLNHGSFGACPTAVLEEQSRWRARLEAEPVRFFMRELEPAMDAVRTRLGAFVGCDPEELVWVSNATTGVNTVLRSLRLKPGDELLTTDHGYNACTNALAFAADQAQAKVVVAAVPFPLASADEVTRAVLGAVTPHTRFALIDHITSPTGLIFPVEALTRGLQARGVEVMIDGAHGPGMVPLDLRALGADWYTGNLHKWVCAPKGAGFLHVPRARQAALRPLVISHGANATRTDRSRFRVEFDWTGTADPTPWLSVPQALATLEQCEPGGWPEVMEKNRALALEARALLARSLGVKVPAPEEMIGALAALPLPGREAGPGALPGSGGLDPLQNRLFEEHQIEVPVFAWPGGGQRLIRVAAQRYNRRADYERLARALGKEAPGSASNQG